jgi:methionyl-tRNA formyltransferase
VAGRASALGIPIRDARAVRDPATAAWMRAQGVELLLNVHSLYIVASDLLAAPTLGAYNLHPGLLPEYAGLNVPSWALYEGATHHGVTLHRMAPCVDAGPIAYSDTFEIGERDTGLSVMVRCTKLGLALIDRLLACVEAGQPIPAHEQDLLRRRWFSAGPPDSGRLDWNRPARQIADFVRACDYRPFPSPWGFPRCTADGIELGIVTARALGAARELIPGSVVRADAGAVLVAASDGWVRVEEVELGGQVRTAAEVLRNGLRLEG